jgi:hypothetical protein
VSVVGVKLHMHRDVVLCSIEHDELTAVLLLRQQLGHAAQPVPRLWNGRIWEVRPATGSKPSICSPARPFRNSGIGSTTRPNPHGSTSPAGCRPAIRRTSADSRSASHAADAPPVPRIVRCPSPVDAIDDDRACGAPAADLLLVLPDRSNEDAHVTNGRDCCSVVRQVSRVPLLRADVSATLEKTRRRPA